MNDKITISLNKLKHKLKDKLELDGGMNIDQADRTATNIINKLIDEK